MKKAKLFYENISNLIFLLFGICCFFLLLTLVDVGISEVGYFVMHNFQIGLSVLLITILYFLNFKLRISSEYVLMDSYSRRIFSLIIITAVLLINIFIRDWQLLKVSQIWEYISYTISVPISIYVFWRAYVVMRVTGEMPEILKKYGMRREPEQFSEYNKTEYIALNYKNEEWLIDGNTVKSFGKYEYKAYQYLLNKERGQSIFNPFSQ